MTDDSNRFPAWLIILLVQRSSELWRNPHRLKELPRDTCPTQSICSPLTSNIEFRGAKESQAFERMILFLQIEKVGVHWR